MLFILFNLVFAVVGPAAQSANALKLVSVSPGVDAFRDPVFKQEPKIVPAGKSLVWALAKESGRFEDRLRYPGEDGEYEKARMDALGL
jgi:hypothetical protein